MKSFLIILTILTLAFPLNAKEKDYLFLKVKRDSAGNEVCGYIDKNEDIRIEFGKYLFCFTDTLKYFAAVVNQNQEIVGINKEESVLFKIFPFDNGPDYPSDGLFRIIENEKIGYANLKGEIAINPQFDAATPFREGFAAFCEGCEKVYDGGHWSWENGKWGVINKKGEVVIDAEFDEVIDWDKKEDAYFEVRKGEKTLNIKTKSKRK